MNLSDRIQTRAYYLSEKHPESSDIENWINAEKEEAFNFYEAGLAYSKSGAKQASFHFLELLIEMPINSSLLFDSNGVLLWDSPWAPYLIHEYVHYLQGVSTFIGQGMIMNWFAVAISAAKELKDLNQIPLPLHHPSQWRPEIKRANDVLEKFFSEVKALNGTVHPLRPESEAKQFEPYSFYKYSWPHPSYNELTENYALSLLTHDKRPFGVPLLGDAIIEGMAQIAQRLCAGDDADNMLKPVTDSNNIYYSVVYRLIRQKFPSWDAALLTLIVADAALCSRSPDETLFFALENIKKKSMPTTPDGYFDIRRELQIELNLASTTRFILNEIDLAEGGIPEEFPLGAYFKHLLKMFRKTWQIRQVDPSAFLDTNYRSHWFNRMTAIVGAPPVVFADRDHVRSFSSDSTLEAACHAFRGVHDIFSSFRDIEPKECSLLRSKACVHHKVPACKSNVLEVPLSDDGKACLMVFAAHQLGLYKRPVKWPWIKNNVKISQAGQL